MPAQGHNHASARPHGHMPAQVLCPHKCRLVQAHTCTNAHPHMHLPTQVHACTGANQHKQTHSQMLTHASAYLHKHKPCTWPQAHAHTITQAHVFTSTHLHMRHRHLSSDQQWCSMRGALHVDLVIVYSPESLQRLNISHTHEKECYMAMGSNHKSLIRKLHLQRTMVGILAQEHAHPLL